MFQRLFTSGSWDPKAEAEKALRPKVKPTNVFKKPRTQGKASTGIQEHNADRSES